MTASLVAVILMGIAPPINWIAITRIIALLASLLPLSLGLSWLLSSLPSFATAVTAGIAKNKRRKMKERSQRGRRTGRVSRGRKSRE